MNNANQDDLWKVLTLQGHKDFTLDLNLDIKTIMDSWTLKMGYPVVDINRIVNNESVKLILKQKWFLLNPLSKLFSQHNIYDNYKWYIPFTFTTKNEMKFEFESKPYWMKPNVSERNFAK